MSYPAKGSLIIADGTGRVTIIPPANDGEVLVRDSTTVEGVKWTTITNAIPMPAQYFKASATKTNSSSSSSYEAIISMVIPGENTSKISSITVLSKMHPSITSYNIRIFDVTNNNTIAEATFSNTSMASNNMGVLSNLPVEEAVIEIQSQKNGGANNKEVYIYEANIRYT